MARGIYRIINNINQKSYIGKSEDIEKRIKHHKMRYCMNGKDFNKHLYKAMRKYGIENFTFSIVEVLDENQDINEKEKYWIQYYDTYGKNGYNETCGGDGGVTVSNPRVTYGKLTDEEVIYLRKRYLECKYPSSYIYQIEFKDKISYRGFQAIWLGENAKEIMPEIFTEENKKKQIHLSRKYEGVLRRRIDLKTIQLVREENAAGTPLSVIWKRDFSNIYSEGGFRDVIRHTHFDEEVNLDGKMLAL